MGHAPALYRHWENCVEQNQRLRQQLHDRDHTIEHLVQANHALHDELAAARERAERAEAELARMRPVVEAAEAFVRATRGLFGGTVDVFSPDVAERTWERVHEALVALDAAREEAHHDA